jgi:DNA-binding CsgD family transcriptional regulator
VALASGEPVFGRDVELDAVWRALGGPGRVVVAGPPGIGKTTVWRAVVDRARRHGWTVLCCGPTEAEAVLAFAALADLLEPLGDHIATLPPPQRASLEGVLLTGPPERIDERTVGAATRGVLAEVLARHDRPVLAAVDDAQWLDPPSQRALRFALRRLPGLAVLVTARTGPSEPTDPLGLGTERGTPPPATVELSPLGVGALHHVIRARVGASLGRPLLARMAREAGGNPLVAIELARAVSRLPRLPSPADDLPWTRHAGQDLVRAALEALPAPTRWALDVVSLLAVPRPGHLDALGIALGDLGPAEDAGIVAVDAGGVRFVHPTYASTVRAALPDTRRRQLHRLLAGAETDPDERARHLGRATVAPDEAVADALEAAAARQRARGAPELAAELYQRAADLTPLPDGEAGWRRLLGAARCHLDSGDHRAAAALSQAVSTRSTGEVRAEALLLQAVVSWTADQPIQDAVELAEAALASVPEGSPLTGRILAHLAGFEDRPEAASRHAARAVMLLSDTDADRDLLASALLLAHYHEVRAGRTPPPGLIERGLALEGDRPTWLAGTVPAIWWKGVDDHHRARQRLAHLLDTAIAHGDEPWQLELLTHLGECELLAGRYDDADRHIRLAHDLGLDLGTQVIGQSWLAGEVAARRGELHEARAVAQRGLTLAAGTGDRWVYRIHLHLLAFVELCEGRYGEAAAAYTELAAVVDDLGIEEPLSLRFEPDWVEACAGVGDLATAARAADRLTRRHRRLPRPWTELGVASSRVLLAGAGGQDTSGPAAELEAVLGALAPETVPLEQARGWLVAGMAHRRARRKRTARHALDTAEAVFSRLGAEAFAVRARAEAARIGGRSPAPVGLTETERRVASLAAAGRSNREIAGELFISPKTVEANLARVYRKLGIARRAQLAARVAPAGAGGETS